MEIDLKDYIKIIRKRLWLIALIVIVACVATAIVSIYFMKPVYEASTKLIVNKSDQRQTIEQLDLNAVNLNLRLIDTYKEIIKTSRVMDKVVERHPEFGLTSEQLSRRIKVSSVNNSLVMLLVIQDGSYTQAAQMVNAISEVFIEEIPLIYTLDNVSLLSEAKTDISPAPVKPNKTLNVAISFVLSLMVAVGLAFLLEYLDDTIKTEEEVREYLQLSTLTMIMKMKDEDLYPHSSSTSHSKAGDLNHAPAKVNQ